MSTDLEDELPEEEPPPDCFTYSVVIRVVAPGTPVDGALHDVEFISEDPSLSDSEVREEVEPLVRPWLQAFCNSPRARRANVRECEWDLVAVSILHGC